MTGQMIFFDSGTIDRLCEEDPDFISKGRDIGKEETKSKLGSLSFEDFKNNFSDYWTSLGFCNLSLMDVIGKDEIKLKLENFNFNQNFINAYLEGAVSECLGQEYMLEKSTRDDSIFILKPISAELNLGKESASNWKPKYEVAPGTAFVLDHKIGLDMFSDLVKQGKTGLCITRTFPDVIRSQYDLKNTSMVWITEKSGDGFIHPKRIDFELQKMVNEFIKQTGEDGVLLFDCLEYMMAHNKPEEVYKTILKWKDNAVFSGTTVLLPLSETALPEYYPKFSIEFSTYKN